MLIGEVIWMTENQPLDMCSRLEEQLQVGGARSKRVWPYQLLRKSIIIALVSAAQES